MSELPTPSAPSCIAWRTSARIRCSCSGFGSTSLSPSSCCRTVVAPTKEATLGAIPRLSRKARYSPSVVHSIGYLTSPWRSIAELLHVGVQRSHRPALAHHLQRHALANVALGPRVDDEGLGRPAEHVDEAGRDRQAVRVDLLRGAAGAARSHVDDLVALDRDVADHRVAAASVVNRAAADQHVVDWLRWRACAAGEKHCTPRPQRASRSFYSSLAAFEVAGVNSRS